MKKILYLVILLVLCACGTKTNDSSYTSKNSIEENATATLFQGTDRVHHLVTKRALRDSTYYHLLDVDFDGIDEWLYHYVEGAYALSTYDVYELCGDSLIIKHAYNEVHDHFFIDENTCFDTINKRIINHFNSGCSGYVEYVYQADEKGDLTLIYDERTKWDFDKQEPISEITHH